MQEFTDRTIENAVSKILRTGVIVSGLIVLIGGSFYLAKNGSTAVDYRQFASQPVQHRLVGRIIDGVLRYDPLSTIQFGILCLIATPITRVAYSLFGFTMEHDRTYVAVTVLVLAILLSSLLSGAAGGV